MNASNNIDNDRIPAQLSSKELGKKKNNKLAGKGIQNVQG